MTDRNKQIIAAATILFLTDGVGVSTANIAKAAGVSNGTLFNAFPTKQVLIDSIYRKAKTAMFAALPHSGDAPFNRAHLYENWQGYLAWSSVHPEDRQIMHLLLDAGLASAETRAQVDADASLYVSWIQDAFDHGVIRGPDAAYIGKLIFLHIDLAITEGLKGKNTDLAFDMLCNSIGLNQ